MDKELFSFEEPNGSVNKWNKKFKGDANRGGAWIYVHPDLPNAIVKNGYGIRYKGISYPAVAIAMEEAEKDLKAS